MYTNSLGVSFVYILNIVGDRAEPCGTPACIILGVDISLSTETEISYYKDKS
jgi:hypothetical protein